MPKSLCSHESCVVALYGRHVWTALLGTHVIIEVSHFTNSIAQIIWPSLICATQINSHNCYLHNCLIVCFPCLSLIRTNFSRILCANYPGSTIYLVLGYQKLGHSDLHILIPAFSLYTVSTFIITTKHRATIPCKWSFEKCCFSYAFHEILIFSLVPDMSCS